MDKYVIIVAGGSGMRMGSDVPKQFLQLCNKPMLWYPVTAFLDAFADIKVILVIPAGFLKQGTDLKESLSAPEQVEIVAGGNNRFQSVQKGLNHVTTDSIVFIHDGVRCLVTSGLIRRCYEAALEKGNAVPAISAVDTIRIETINGSEMIARSKVKIIQTPQTFYSKNLIKAYRQDYKDMFTDDASVVESAGEKIHLVEGEATNIKLTKPLDLLIAEQILIERDKK